MMAEILTAKQPSVEATLAEAGSWQAALKRAYRSSHQLCATLGIPASSGCAAAEGDFPVFAPREYVARMQRGNPHDPLLLQVLATAQELLPQPEGMSDPVGDHAAERLPGLLQKYDRRALLITTGACAVHCRYCFRRHYPYETAPRGPAGWEPALKAIAQDTSLDEVILSGGDPLTLNDTWLTWLIQQIADIPHIRRLRIHTRLPAMIPQRVCPELLHWLQGCSLPVFMVLHFNHATEIDQPVSAALKQLRAAGATLLNQAVLLRGINDSFEAQRDLCLALAGQQVLPYYLHQLDPVQGAMHFAVPDEQAVDIARDLTHHLPGYCVPRLVREVAGEPSKRRLV